MKTLKSILKEAKSQALRRNTVTIYVPVDDHLYYDGKSYRVRVTRNGVRISKNTPSKTEATKLKNSLLKSTWVMAT